MVVVILGCGGTISMGTGEKSLKTSSGFRPEFYIDDLLKKVPDVKEFAEIEAEQVLQMDSANMQPEDWILIARAVNKHINRPEVEGIVVLHGTDTMVYSASSVALMVQNLPKPVVFTGAQVPLTMIGSDGARNLIHSLWVAKSAPIAESVIVFNNRIMRAVRTLKMREYELDSFDCVDRPILGDLALDIHILDPKHHGRNQERASFHPYLSPNVALITLFPGLNPKSLEKYVFEGDYKGLVLEAYGAGNIPISQRSLIPVLKTFREQEIPVVITTQCVWGRTELMLYETGRQAYKAGAIPGFDMTAPVAMTKLMWVLGKNMSGDFQAVEGEIHENYVGEISPDIIPRRDLL